MENLTFTEAVREIDFIMIVPSIRNEVGVPVVATSGEATEWVAFAVEEGDAVPREVWAWNSAHEIGEAVGSVAVQRPDFRLSYRSSRGLFGPSAALTMCDELATEMWDEIDENEPDLPDAPEDYAHFADGHPLDELRLALGDQIGYFG